MIFILNNLKPLTAEEAMKILTTRLLGEDYYIVDPVSPEQAYAIIVDDITIKYRKSIYQNEKRVFKAKIRNAANTYKLK